MSPCHPASIGGSGSPSCHWNLGTEIPAESILGENCVQSVNRRHELTLVQVSESFWTGVRHARACLASRERGWLPRSRSMALRPLFLPPPRLLFPRRRAGHAPCRERPALQRSLRGAAPGGARPSVLGAGHTDGPRRALSGAARRLAAAEQACLQGLRRGLPFGRQTAAEGLWVGRCLQTQPQPPPA